MISLISIRHRTLNFQTQSAYVSLVNKQSHFLKKMQFQIHTSYAIMTLIFLHIKMLFYSHCLNNSNLIDHTLTIISVTVFKISCQYNVNYMLE